MSINLYNDCKKYWGDASADAAADTDDVDDHDIEEIHGDKFHDGYEDDPENYDDDDTDACCNAAKDEQNPNYGDNCNIIHATRRNPLWWSHAEQNHETFTNKVAKDNKGLSMQLPYWQRAKLVLGRQKHAPT